MILVYGRLRYTWDIRAKRLACRRGRRLHVSRRSVFIGEDDNSGGGSEAGLDARRTYRLDLTGITPHPVQGFHVKLTVNAEGSQGADTKHKVFWVTGCDGYPGYPPSAQ
jgi:hypothetical protein